MIVEGAVALWAAIAAHSISLAAFGADSFIELIAGVVLLWRLERQRQNRSTHDIQRAERIAAWVTAVALVALCLYIVAEAVVGVITPHSDMSSIPGIGVALASVAIMPILAARKRAVATELHSAALRADAACSITCAYMAGALLVSLVLNMIVDWGWLDDAVSLVFLIWLVPETKEAFKGAREGELRCECE